MAVERAVDTETPTPTNFDQPPVTIVLPPAPALNEGEGGAGCQLIRPYAGTRRPPLGLQVPCALYSEIIAVIK
jgi:hypothetical protein